MSANNIKMKKRNIVLLSVLGILILGGIFFLLRKTASPVQFLRSNPVHGSVKVSLFDPVTLEFNSLTQDLQSKVSYKLSPDNKTSFSWKNSSTLVITPFTKFDFGTEFSLSVYYQQTLLKTINFRTKSEQELTLQEQQAVQTVDDYLYAQQQKQQLTDRPWTKSLPIDNSQYEAVDDPQNNSIFVRIRDKTTNIDTLKKQITNKLISI